MIERARKFCLDQLYTFIGPECSDIILRQKNYFSGYCNRLIVSKLVSFVLVCGGLLIKLPQIVKITLSKSAEGISLTSLLFETASLYVSVAYNIRKGVPFLAYGELAFLLFQNVDIIILVLMMRRLTKTFFVYIFVQVLLQADLFKENFVPNWLLGRLQCATIPLMLVSKMPQLVSLIRTKSKGQLSMLTTGLQFCGSIARMYTAVQAGVDDRLILAGFLVGSILNGLIFLLSLYYAMGPAKKLSGRNFTEPKVRTRSLARRANE